ncbi:MAG: nucleotidyltransferase domain-containing protein [Campylobacterales bacterium]
MIDKSKIIAILKDKKDMFNIDKFVLFGSFASGRYHQNSDIDIAYILKDEAKLSFDKYLELEEDLQNSLYRHIDLMNFNKLNPLVKLNAKKNFIYV